MHNTVPTTSRTGDDTSRTSVNKWVTDAALGPGGLLTPEHIQQNGLIHAVSTTCMDGGQNEGLAVTRHDPVSSPLVGPGSGSPSMGYIRHEGTIIPLSACRARNPWAWPSHR